MKQPEIKKVLVIGSGPAVIGRSAEFDYAGTQALRTLKEEGLKTILINSNPSTVMTDKGLGGSDLLGALKYRYHQTNHRKENRIASFRQLAEIWLWSWALASP